MMRHLGRGAELFHINCTACHGTGGKGDGPVAAFLKHKKPADLTSPAVQFLSDGAIFMVITNGMPGAMPLLTRTSPSVNVGMWSISSVH